MNHQMVMTHVGIIHLPQEGISGNELIQNLNDGDNVKANKQFKTVMADKLSAALDAKKIEIASGMIQRNEVESEEEQQEG